MARTISEQLDFEKRRDHYEKNRLDTYSSEATRKVQYLPESQLRAAATLKDHTDWNLSKVGRAAHRELIKRGLAQ